MSLEKKAVELVEYDISPGDSEGRIMRFQLDDQQAVDVYITSSTCQKELEGLFTRILKTAIGTENDFVFELTTLPEGKENDFYAAATKQYIADLNHELTEVLPQIRKERTDTKEAATS
jgi:hypothetical protein